MSNGYKCDRCKKMFEGKPAIEFSDFINGNIDLCEKCVKDFREFMKAYDKTK